MRRIAGRLTPHSLLNPEPQPACRCGHSALATAEFLLASLDGANVNNSTRFQNASSTHSIG